MFLLLAESKTMLADQSVVSTEEFKNNCPVFEPIAEAEMAHIAGLKASVIAEILGISHALAAKTLSLAYDFPNKSAGYKALFGFTGEAYRGLDANSLSSEAIIRAFSHLRIISSLYGYLKPSDIIKPYRLEFNKPIFSDNTTAIKIFKQKATVEFAKEIKESLTQDVIDLLPGDADKLLDWKILRAFAKVHKIVFKSIQPDGSLKTPLAKTLKEHRGKMARFILENNIESFSQLCSTPSPDFLFSPEDSKPLLPVFMIAP